MKFLLLWSCVWSVGAFDMNFDKLLKKRAPVAQCRAACLENFGASYGKFNYHEASNAGCTTKANWKCNMCWDYCETLAVFAKTRPQMCSDDICLEGCKHACTFHNTFAAGSPIDSPNLSPPKLLHNKITPSHQPFQRLVYSIFALRPNQTWTELKQIADLKTYFPDGLDKYYAVVVISVSKNGLLNKVERNIGLKLRSKRSLVPEKFSNFLGNNYNVIVLIGLVFSCVIAYLCFCIKQFKRRDSKLEIV